MQERLGAVSSYALVCPLVVSSLGYPRITYPNFSYTGLSSVLREASVSAGVYATYPPSASSPVAKMLRLEPLRLRRHRGYSSPWRIAVVGFAGKVPSSSTRTFDKRIGYPVFVRVGTHTEYSEYSEPVPSAKALPFTVISVAATAACRGLCSKPALTVTSLLRSSRFASPTFTVTKYFPPAVSGAVRPAFFLKTISTYSRSAGNTIDRTSAVGVNLQSRLLLHRRIYQ